MLFVVTLVVVYAHLTLESSRERLLCEPRRNPLQVEGEGHAALVGGIDGRHFLPSGSTVSHSASARRTSLFSTRLVALRNDTDSSDGGGVEHDTRQGLHLHLLEKKGRLDYGGQLVFYVHVDLRCLLKHWAVSAGVIWGWIQQARRTADDGRGDVESR